MARNVTGLIVGLAAAFFIYWTFLSINQMISPVPEGLDREDKEAVLKFAKTIPTIAHVVVLISHILGAFLGAFVAGKVGERPVRYIPLVIGGFLLIMGIIKLISLPHPVWFTIVDLVVHIPLAILGYKLATKSSNASIQ